MLLQTSSGRQLIKVVKVVKVVMFVVISVVTGTVALWHYTASVATNENK